jgi:hypothetical protein
METKMKNLIWIVIGFLFVFSIGMFILFNNEDTNEFPKSEYTKCIEASQDRSCEIEYLEKQGITDGIDCIIDNTNPICEDIERYNAEVDASNYCFGKKPNLFDCAELMK